MGQKIFENREAGGHSHSHGGEVGHSHSHGVDHFRGTESRRLRRAAAIIGLFFVIELVGGLVSGSLALISDAGHMLTDFSAMLLALLAFWFAAKPPDLARTYGYRRIEVFAALINAALLILIAGGIIHEAVSRMAQPESVNVTIMGGVAVAGLAANIAALWVISSGGGEASNLNLRGAIAHVVGDTLASIGVIIAALVIHYTGRVEADPIISIVISLMIVYGAWRLLWEVVHVLMQGVPPEVDLAELKKSILGIDGVVEICDIHIWSLASDMHMLDAHVIVNDIARGYEIQRAVTSMLREKYRLGHTTIQIDDAGSGACGYNV